VRQGVLGAGAESSRGTSAGSAHDVAQTHSFTMPLVETPEHAAPQHAAPQHAVPHQRTESAPPTSAPVDGTAPTAVIPRAGSAASRRLRPTRAWMLAVPVDFLAAAAPALWYPQFWRGTLSMAVLVVVSFAVGDFYEARRHLSFLDELPGLVGRLLAASAVVALASAWRHDSMGHVGQFMHAVAISGGLVLVGRLLTRHVVLVARRHRWASKAAIVVGYGPVAVEIAGILQRYPQYGLRFVGFVDDRPPVTGYDRTSWLGNLDELEELIQYTETDVVIVADATVEDERLMEAVRRPACMMCDLLVVPRLHHARTQAGVSDHIGAIPILRIRRPTLTGPRWAIKRAIDILFAVTALAALSPLLLLCAIAVYLEGGRGIFFLQPRVGRFGKQFDVIKFRSMRPRLEADPATTWSVGNDPRVGPVGRFMRRTSLDELPQLWNILRGDMTLVGPRPERPFFVEKFAAEHPRYMHRHRAPVGLTGLAQVSGLRGDTSISDRARFDNYYIENWSPWLDFKVIARTVAEVLRGGGR
jgi:exopolysaccharide biosynthesis polyprenyl glycosylphosphotransferase